MTQGPVRLYLVDGSGYIFRAYHALPPLTRKSDGMPTGAVAGYCNMLYKLLADVGDEHEPTHFAVIFDHSARTFRNDLYPEYKAHRPEPPDDLKPQFAYVREATRAFNVPCIEVEGFEADDIIASYARAVANDGGEVVIVSSDKDLMQLVGDRISMLDTMKNKKIGRDEVIEKFGVPPDKVIDVQALAGDSVDNVPGVPGVGIKTAAQLILEYGDLETLLARAGEIRQEKRRQTLIENAEAARISRKLVELKSDMPLPTPLDEIRMPQIDPEKLLPFLQKMEFGALTKRVEERFKTKAPVAAAIHAPAASSAAPIPFDRTRYEAIFAPDRLGAFLAKSYDRGALAFHSLTDRSDAMRPRLIGLGLAIGPGEAAYVPFAHGAGGLSFDDVSAQQQMPVSEALQRLKPVLADPSILKIAHDMKAEALILDSLGAGVVSFDDVMLISYALDCGRAGHSLEELSSATLGHEKLKFSEVWGSGRNQKPVAEIEIARAAEYAAEAADISMRLHASLKPRLAAEGLAAVYETLERPMPPAVMAMEKHGIKIDPAVLARLSADFATRMHAHEEEAYKLAGGPFNMGSAKQVSDILFGKLQLPGARKTPTGAWSTKADILEELAAEGHALPRALLNWRGLSKLKSTYTDSLPLAVNSATGRIHTSFALAATTTGRLSSNDPNLQNIPIRTEDGAKIRNAFVADKGNVLISADYSQIELRLLAHIADLKSMKKAFADGVDIHAMTASEMFGVPVEGMDPMVRRRAKAINFGIIYGISAFGLANQLGIGRGEAKDYISSYFLKFPGIKAYMDETVRGAREKGYVETIFGRRTHVSAINDKNPALRGYAERQAINAPIQGAAADVIRRAMIRIPKALTEKGLKARMLLQVHDELVFEASTDEADATIAVVTDVMAKAPLPAVSLSAPLVVEARAGRNWGEAH